MAGASLRCLPNAGICGARATVFSIGRVRTEQAASSKGALGVPFALLIPGRASHRRPTINMMKPNPIIQSFFVGSILGAKVDGISLMQVHPLDPYTLLNISTDSPEARPESKRIPGSSTNGNSRRTRQKPAFTSDETRHHFAIEALDKSGPFRRQPYLYMCVRCKWMFRINDTRGSVIALDGLGRELQEPENAKRVVTFHRGPCPAFPVVEYSVVETQRESAFAGYLSRFVKAVQSLTQLGRHRGHGRREQTIS
jgi:hypothetical protein